MGCILPVLLGGRKIKLIGFRFWIYGCAGQLSTISAIFLSSNSNFLSSSRTHSSKITLSIQLFDWERFLHGKVLTPLKHRGLADFPITNMGSLSPSASAAVKPVNLTLLCFPPVHFSDFKCRDLFGKALKNRPNSSAL